MLSPGASPPAAFCQPQPVDQAAKQIPP